jgi:Fur family ferric uptake transcriptional regulator
MHLDVAAKGRNNVRSPTCSTRLRAMSATGSAPAPPASWEAVRERLHERGLRWTPQRRTLIDVLATTEGHVTGSELVERCRLADPTTIPSTVYRTLDVLEELGLISHSHGVDGREEFHVLPRREHGHLHCRDCGATWEVDRSEAVALVSSLKASRGFAVDVSHLAIVGRCAGCRDGESTRS